MINTSACPHPPGLPGMVGGRHRVGQDGHRKKDSLEGTEIVAGSLTARQITREFESEALHGKTEVLFRPAHFSRIPDKDSDPFLARRDRTAEPTAHLSGNFMPA
jgi:hypothetical protein